MVAARAADLEPRDVAILKRTMRVGRHTDGVVGVFRMIHDFEGSTAFQEPFMMFPAGSLRARPISLSWQHLWAGCGGPDQE